MLPERKIIHVDMDAFYASVELKDQPQLKGKPVVVAWDGARSVVCAASYEARQFGLHSAMSVAKAKMLCPHAIFIAPNFMKYRAVSAQIHRIFKKYTDLVEPLSLDEAYLDVSTNKFNIPSATWVAEQIRHDIFLATDLTASAGVAPNKFLAKIASDWNKPNGQFVIAPKDVADFLIHLPLKKIPGVGSRTLEKMQTLGLQTIADIQPLSSGELAHYFGRYGYRLYDLARGIDQRQVKNQRILQQISTETTFLDDLRLPEVMSQMSDLASQLWQQSQKKNVWGKTITLKLKTHQFQTITRSMSFAHAIRTEEQLLSCALLLFDKVTAPLWQKYRLLGIGLSHLQTLPEIEQQLSLDLFS